MNYDDKGRLRVVVENIDDAIATHEATYPHSKLHDENHAFTDADHTDVDISLAVGEDGKVVYYDHSAGKFQLKTISAAESKVSRVYFVDATNGNDSNDGNDIAAPKATVASAEGEYANEGSIFIAPVVDGYTEDVTFTYRTFLASWKQHADRNYSTVALNGNQTFGDGGAASGIYFYDNDTNTVITINNSDFEFKDCILEQAGAGNFLSISTGCTATLTNCQLYDGILAGAGDAIVIGGFIESGADLSSLSGTLTLVGTVVNSSATLPATWQGFYVTETGVLKIASQTANYGLFAPDSSNGTPTFRAMVDNDIPSSIARDSELHDAVTLDGNAGAVLSLSTQELGLDSQAQNYVFAAPSGGAGVPSFRALVAADLAAHASTHIDGDEIDGDKLDIDFSPSNYVPDASASEADDTDDLAAHLNGIDSALNPFWSRNPSTPSRTDNNTLSVSDNTANQNFYIPGRIIGFEISSTWYYAVVESYSSGTIEIIGDSYTSAVDVYGLVTGAKDIILISNADDTDGTLSAFGTPVPEAGKILMVSGGVTGTVSSTGYVKLWKDTDPAEDDVANMTALSTGSGHAIGTDELIDPSDALQNNTVTLGDFLWLEVDDANGTEIATVAVKFLPKVLRLKLEG